MLRRLLRFAALGALLAVGLTSCSPGIHITRYRPARYNLGATRRVALLNVQGPPEAVGVVSHELGRQIVNHGYFHLYNTQPQSVAMVILPGATIVQNIETVRSSVPAEVYISAAVQRWDYSEQQRTEEYTEHGKRFMRVVRVPYASVVVNFQVVHAQTGRVVVVRDFVSNHEGRKYQPDKGEHAFPGRELRDACAHATSHFLHAITPATVSEKIVLDDDEEAVEPGIDLCKKGALDAAMASFEKVLAASPSSSAATYNLAVLLEAQGDYQRADEMYQRAISLNPGKDLYRNALNQMRRRIAEDQSLTQPI